MKEEFELTTLTSKGQIVIPQNIREKMRLQKGMKFIVMGGMDKTIMLKKIEAPQKEFQSLLRKVRKESQKTPFVRSAAKLSEKKRLEAIEKLIHESRGVNR